MSRTYANVATALRELAARCDLLAADADLPDEPHVSLDIMPGGQGHAYKQDNDAVVAAVDTVSEALLGTSGTTRHMVGGSYHRNASGQIGPIKVGVFDRVADPTESDLKAEVERLRAELAAQSGGTR